MLRNVSQSILSPRRAGQGARRGDGEGQQYPRDVRGVAPYSNPHFGEMVPLRSGALCFPAAAGEAVLDDLGLHVPRDPM
jgi:hypothetical protein